MTFSLLFFLFYVREQEFVSVLVQHFRVLLKDFRVLCKGFLRSSLSQSQFSHFSWSPQISRIQCQILQTFAPQMQHYASINQRVFSKIVKMSHFVHLCIVIFGKKTYENAKYPCKLLIFVNFTKISFAEQKTKIPQNFQ